MNWIAIIVATVAGMAVGFVWYNPKVFGTAWMKSVNMTMDDTKGVNMFKVFGLSIVMTLIISIYFARMMAYHGTEDMTIHHGLYHGLEPLAYLVLPVVVTGALYEKRSFKYMAIIIGHWAVTFAVISVIHSLWR